MKNYIFILLLIIMFSCNEKKTVEVEKHHFFNNVNLMEYNGKRVFYLLDALDRLNYKVAYPIVFDRYDKDFIVGFNLVYFDSIKIKIYFDSSSFKPYLSKDSDALTSKSNWSVDDFLKEKIDFVSISGVKNGEFIFVSSYKEKVIKKK